MSTERAAAEQHPADHDCCHHPAGFNRRAVLKGALGVAAVGAVPLVELTNASMAFATSTDPTLGGDVLVVLSMRGGFDGLSAFAPVGDPNYTGWRPLPTGNGNANIGVPAGAVGANGQAGLVVPTGGALNSTGVDFNLHPSLAPLFPLFNAGTFGAVVAAGLPAPNRSHFEAITELEDARPGSLTRSGWLNRLLGEFATLTPLSAVQMGNATTPQSMQGTVPTVGMYNIGSFNLSGSSASDLPRWTAALNAMHDVGASAPRTTTALRESTTATLGALSSAASIPKSTAGGYSNSGLANALKESARLVKYNASLSLGVKVITLDVGDWDMHVGLGAFNDNNGWMTGNLSDLATNLAAFAADLGSLMSSTTLVTVSEFGRRVWQNDSYGLDHGWGNQMMMLGGHIKPGLQGKWTPLDTAPVGTTVKYQQIGMTSGDVSVTTDYRSVFADILKNRLNANVTDLDGTDSSANTANGVFPPSTYNLPFASGTAASPTSPNGSLSEHSPAAAIANQHKYSSGDSNLFTTV